MKKYDHEDGFVSGEEDDFSPDYLTYRKPVVPSKPKGTSGPGKRGKNLFIYLNYCSISG